MSRFLPFLILITTTLACGVKGPPLPPFAKTPAESERREKGNLKPVPSESSQSESEQKEEESGL